MRKHFILTVLMLLIACPAYAGTSASYGVSVEVFSGGGTDETSAHYMLHGKLRGTAYGIRTSTNYKIGEGFMNASFNALKLQVIVTSISPASGKNTDPVAVTIKGANFAAGAVASLEMAPEADITGESLIVVDSNTITCTFNLIGKAVGNWDVVVMNPDGKSGKLSGGFAVIKPSGHLGVIGRPVNFPNPFDPERQTTTIKYVLSKDAHIFLNIYNINGDRIWQKVYSAGEAGGAAGINQIIWDGENTFSQTVANGIYVFQIESGGETLATGKIAVFR